MKFDMCLKKYLDIIFIMLAQFFVLVEQIRWVAGSTKRKTGAANIFVSLFKLL